MLKGFEQPDLTDILHLTTALKIATHSLLSIKPQSLSFCLSFLQGVALGTGL